MVRVGTVGHADWAVLRALRLRALEVDAEAFGSTLEQEQTLPEEFWRGRIAIGAWFLAWVEGHAVGVAAAVPSASPNSAERQLDAMWVAPAWRGRGVGEALVDAVIVWARNQGATSLSLTVLDGNGPARCLYERTGFRPTGEREPRPRDPGQMHERLRMPLFPPGSSPLLG